jgi:hypothetical protein
LEAKWRAAGIKPAPNVDDAGYLRRTSLDMIGTLPTAEEVTQFLNEPGANRREKWIDSLLANDRYAKRWAEYWEIVLLGRLYELPTVDRVAFNRWLQQQWQANASWDQIVRALITAEGVNISGNAFGDFKSEPANKSFNPAVNWFIRHGDSLPELSAATSRIFMGMQIQCAQCHDHKEEKWKQDDFRRFTAFYVKTWPMIHGNYMTSGKISLVPLDVRDRLIAPPTGGQLEQFFGSYKEYIGVTPRTLDGQEFKKWSSRRVALADWIVARENPTFAPAFVNRMWGEMLGSGFVEPIDDFRPGNPAVAPEALQLLADDFRQSGYDIKRLLKVIALSRPYQTACQHVESTVPRNGLWSHYPLKPLSIEVLFDTVLAATGAGQPLDKLSQGRLDLIRGAFVQQFVLQMGTDENSEPKEVPESIAKALMQLNGVLFTGAVQTGNQLALDQVWKASSDDEVRIEQLYLRTLSRRPERAEKAYWKKFVNQERTLVQSPGAESKSPYKVKGLSAILPSVEIRQAKPDADFRQLMANAKTAPDFAVMAKRITNIVEAGVYVRALRDFSAHAPFQALVEHGGGSSPKAQAYEDLFWSLLNCSEFLNNH